MKAQKGFTLIELIIVIVVLGILAVTAAPQFIDFGSDARQSTLRGAKGAIQGAMDVTYAKAALEDELGEDGSIDSDVTTAYGYPTASATGVIASTSMDAEVVSNDTAVTSDWAYFIVSGTPDTLVLAPGSLVTGSAAADEDDVIDTDCYLTYTEATSSAAATVVVSEDSGC